MAVRQSILWLVVTFQVTLSNAYAGPCTDKIERMQARIDAALEAKLATGPRAAESTSATMHRQPTPQSLAAVEEKLGNLSSEKVDAVMKAMASARAADAAGDEAGCRKALADVENATKP